MNTPGLERVEIPGFSFETGPSYKIAILTTLHRKKNQNISVYIIPTVQCACVPGIFIFRVVSQFTAILQLYKIQLLRI